MRVENEKTRSFYAEECVKSGWSVRQLERQIGTFIKISGVENGTKRIELRLYDEKRQKISIGDIIIFQKESELETTMKVKVVGLLRYNTFE